MKNFSTQALAIIVKIKEKIESNTRKCCKSTGIHRTLISKVERETYITSISKLEALVKVL